MMPNCCHHQYEIGDGESESQGSSPCHINASTSIPTYNHLSLEPKSQRHTRIRKHYSNWPQSSLMLLTTSSLTLLLLSQTIHALTIPTSISTLTRPPSLITLSSTAMPPEETIHAVQPQTKRKPSQPRRPPTTRHPQHRAWDHHPSLVQGLTITAGQADASIPDHFESYFDFMDESFGADNTVDGKVTGEPARPKGRPSSVPGAMSRQTLMEISEGVGRVEKAFGLETVKESDVVEPTAPVVQKKRGRGRPRKNASDGVSVAIPLSAHNERKRTKPQVTISKPAPTATTTTTSPPKRKRRIKDLPPTRPLASRRPERETTGMLDTTDATSPNLQKYYRTELLSTHEEYELGMKIQFMMKAEEVHEGLCLELLRVPRVEEWGAACGFVVEGGGTVDGEDVERIRPVSEVVVGEQDPNMFVGNGLANTNGPGRGKGRVKGPPATALKNIYYDVESEFEDVGGKRVKKKTTPNLKPINRGTPQDFVAMMLEGKEAKQRMVQCNMRLVVSISKRYGHVGVNIADLIQEGSIGLSRAAEKFEPLRGFKFSTYASWWIQQAVFRAIAYHSRTIRLPVHVHNHLNRVRRVRQELQREKGHPPTNEEMADELHMTVEKYNKMLRLSRRAISLDISKYQNNPKDIGHESETTLGDTIDASEVINDENTPEQSVNRVLFRDDLKEMLKVLGEDERAVINARYGLNDGLTQTVTTVAAKMGQTKSWVRSAECCALRKLRRPWYEKRLWEHQNSLTG